MAKKYLYVGCIVAARRDPLAPGGWKMENLPRAHIARSLEQAKADELEIAREEWPESDGWVGHDVHLKEVEESGMLLLRRLLDGELDDEEDEYVM